MHKRVMALLLSLVLLLCRHAGHGDGRRGVRR